MRTNQRSIPNSQDQTLTTPAGPSLIPMRPFRSILSVLLLGGLLSTAGCSGRYIITTTSGAKIVTANKPRLVQSKYVYKDGSGQVVEISALRVRVVEPYSKQSAGRQLSRPELQ